MTSSPRGRRARTSGEAPARRGARDDRIPGHPEDSPGDPESVARLICLRLLDSGPRTRAQLAAALLRRGVPEDVCDRILDRFADVGLVDDRAFAAAWVDSRHHGRGLARRALAAELRRRGVEESTVDDAVGALDDGTQERTARALVARRLPGTRGLEPTVRARRLVGMLARKGYPPGVAFRVVREALEGDGDDRAEDWYPVDVPDEPQPDLET